MATVPRLGFSASPPLQRVSLVACAFGVGALAFAVEAEQEGWEEYFDSPAAELNPAMIEFQQLTVRKWQEHLEKVQNRQMVKMKAQP